MLQSYDVIIAGAGPAGAQCARYLAHNSRYSVLLLDKTQEIGEPKKSTAGTFTETMRIFELPKKIVQYPIHRAVFESPTEQTIIPLEGFVLDFGKLKKFLVEDAVHHGVELRIESAVTAPIIENKKIVGVSYRDLDGVHEVKAKIIIDATGPAAVLATQIGLRKLNPKNHWVGMEFEMERLRLKQQNAMLVRLDNEFAPGGYSWIFSTGKNHAKVGNCWNGELFKKKGGIGSELSYLEKWIKSDERLKNGMAVEMHAGDAYVDRVKKHTADNFMAIGDAASSIHPLFGEGIRPGLYSGMFAAQTVIDALRKKNCSKKQLAEYDRKWAKLGMHSMLSYFASKILYRLSNNSFDKVVKNLRKLDAAAIKRLIANKPSLKDIKTLLPL